MKISLIRTIFQIVFLIGGLLRADPLQVAVLHPLLQEWTEEIAGDSVEVTNLLPGKVNLHDFSPTPADMAKLQDMDLVIAMGKHLEPYLDRLQENLPRNVTLFEAGRRVPSVKVDPEQAAFVCCPRHTHGAIDPHWWHSPLAVRRAVRSLGRELEDHLPDEKDSIRSNTERLMEELESLHVWAEDTLASVPRNQRKLVTAHAAFGYFCNEYRFKAIPVAGISNEGQPTPDFLSDTIQILKENQVRALFPERSAGAAALQALQESTGIMVAPPLIADYVARDEEDSYETMFRSNVTLIVSHLGDTQPE
jgi:zinc/manganese transport system substrate-binding protein